MKILSGLYLVGVLFFLLPQVVQAHFLKTDGSIGAVLHIDPDDDPIAGKSSTFYFDVKDETNKFSITTCGCQVKIQQNNQDVYSQPVTQSGAESVSGSFLFPSQGVYQVSLVGQPLVAGSFAPFQLTYDIRVSAAPSAASSWWDFVVKHWVYGAILVVVIGVYLGVTRYSQRSS